MGGKKLPDKTKIQMPDGMWKESIYINPVELMVPGANVFNIIFTKIIAHSNQIGLLGRVVVRWESDEDILQPGGKRISFFTLSHEEWARRQEEFE